MAYILSVYITISLVFNLITFMEPYVELMQGCASHVQFAHAGSMIRSS